MALGFFTVDQEQNIGSIGPSALKYAKRHKGFVQWHGEGSFKINDLIILLRNQELKIYKYENQDLIPIIRTLMEVYHQNEMILDVIFSGDHIRVYVENQLLHIFIHEQGYTFHMNEKNALIAADDEGIIYFSHKDISEKENNGHQRTKVILWLAGLAPGYGRLASTSKTPFFLDLKQALA